MSRATAAAGDAEERREARFTGVTQPAAHFSHPIEVELLSHTETSPGLDHNWPTLMLKVQVRRRESEGQDEGQDEEKMVHNWRILRCVVCELCMLSYCQWCVNV
jgi:hypothetical protein